MIILTSKTAAGGKATVHGDRSSGLKPLYKGTGKSEADAARNVVSKWWSPAAAATISEVRNKDEINDLTGDHFKDPKRKQVFTVWKFDPKAKPQPMKQPIPDPLAKLPPALRKRASWLINAGEDDTKRGLAAMVDPGTEDDLAILRAAIATEEARPDPRVSRLKPMKAKLARLLNCSNTDARITAANPPAKRVKDVDAMIADYEQSASKEYGLDNPAPVNVEVMDLDPSSLLSSVSQSSVSLSPMAAAALAAVESGWMEARRLADLAKNYARASTAAKALCGLKLRAIREFYFGPRDPRGGRPKMKVAAPGGQTWETMLTQNVGIPETTGKTWMTMADAVETLADREGLGLRAMLEKLPWDWTPEESAMIEATVNRLTEDKTQRQLLQADFLTDLGFTAPERLNASPNQLGKNGSNNPKPLLSPEQTIQVRREGARVDIYGTKQIGRMDPGSHGWWLVNTVQTNGSDIEALPSVEMRAFYDDVVKPFADLVKSLASRK